MTEQGILIQYKDKNDDFVYNGSGLLLHNRNIAITTGVCLAPFIEKCVKRSININCESLNNLLEILIVCEDTLDEHFLAKNIKCKPIFVTQSTDVRTSIRKKSKLMKQKGKFLKIINHDDIENALNSSMSDWNINNMEESISNTTKHFLLSTIVILQINSEINISDEQIYQSIVDVLVPVQYLERGDQVFLETTPFGNFTFLNSYSEGIVANILGDNQCLFLTDASTAPGSEGGPIFLKASEKASDKTSYVIGLVLSSVSFWKDEWCGFTLGITLSSILEKLIVNNGRTNFFEKSSKILCPDFIDNSILQVSCGSGWGTGILVDKKKGIIVTSSHVVRDTNSTIFGKIKGSWKRERFDCNLLYRTSDNKPFDVAILQTKSPIINKMASVKFAKLPPCQGEQVFAFGYPFFKEQIHCIPTMSRGSIARISPFMLQTTCCIHPGASGGAIVRPNGELLGVVVCNTSNQNETSYPFINLAVPAEIIQKPLIAFSKTNDIKVFNCLQNNDRFINDNWNLYNAKL